MTKETLQDFIVLLTDRFHRYEIQNSSVIFLPIKSLTKNIRWHTVHQ